MPIFFSFVDSDNDTLNLALLQYTFKDKEHKIKVAPHGNSVKSESYVRTMPSVMEKLKCASSTNTAKHAIALVENTTGSVTTALSAAGIPRGRQQVDDIRKKLFKTDSDPLFSLMTMCKEGESSKSPDAFVRIVTGAPYPMMVLAFDWVLNNLVRFCASSTTLSPLGIDPTFNLGSFDVTVTTYRHLLLTKQGNVSTHPVLFGPLFIHVKKDFEAYHFFASSLVSKQPQLAKLHCFGTNGEAALVKAFSAVFPGAIHLRCFLHFRQNIEQKLREFGIGAAAVKEYKKDIFGDPIQLQFGLVDSSSESDLDNKLDQLEKKWDDLEIPFNFPPEFHSWFKVYCREVIAMSMLHPVQEKAGLGCPPSPYYTNDIEYKNNILKQHLHRKPSTLPDFVDSMKALITNQRTEVEKAVASHGEYRLVSQYSILACDQQKWFKMSSKQRLGKISSFMKASVIPTFESNSSSGSMQEKPSPLEALTLPVNMARTIWSRTRSIVEDAAITNAPGDDTAYIVRSNSGKRPHYVQPAKGGGYLCDEECLGYKSSKICAHTVAANLKGTGIESVVEWYKKLKYKPNFTALADSGKPSSAGKKNQKGVSKKISRVIHSVTDEADEEDFTSRIPPVDVGEETSLSATTDSGMLGTLSQSTSQSTGSSVCSSYGVVAQPQCGSASQSSVVGSNLSFQQFHNTSVPVGSALRQQVSRHPNVQTNVFNVTPPVQSPQVPQHHFGFISGVPPPPLFPIHPLALVLLLQCHLFI